MKFSFFLLYFAVCALATTAGHAASFDVTSGNTLTTAQTLAAGQTGTVESGGAMTISGSTVAVTVTGNATLTNSGNINQTGTGRAIRDNTGGLTLTVTNNVGATMHSADADVIQMNKPNSNVTFYNYGTLTSSNASAGGSQAIDFNAIATGSNVLYNYSSGLIQATEADAVRPGVSGQVNNDGTIKCTTTTGSSSDGIDAQSNSGISVVNATTGSDTVAGTGTVDGARHGITGGNTNTASDGTFLLSVTNNLGGTIQGDNGSGLNIDGFSAKEVVTIHNYGTITGNGVTGDGDGVDVDGLVDLTNTGTIKSLHAYNDTSEGVTVGGGTIVNSGTIEGDNSATNADSTANTGTGRGMTLAGIDKDPVTDAPIVPPQGIYADTSVDNSGTIRGTSDAGIAVTGAATAFSLSITNRATGLIEGAGTAAAISTGANDATVINYGTITADDTGLAVDLGSGNDSLQIVGGNAAINGDISGGTGTSSLTIAPGVGNSFNYTGAIANFSSVEIATGTTVLSGTSTYSGTTTIDSDGILQLDGSLAGAVIANGLLQGHGSTSGAVQVSGTIYPGDSAGDIVELDAGSLTLNGGSVSTFDLGKAAGSNDKIVSSGSVVIGSGAQLAINLPASPAAGNYVLIQGASVTGTFATPTYNTASAAFVRNGAVSASPHGAVAALPASLTATLVYSATAVTLQLQATAAAGGAGSGSLVPTPTLTPSLLIGFGLMLALLAGARRRLR